MQNRYQKLNTGFTLLEMIVAIFIMSVAFTAIITVMSASIYSSKYARDEITENYLAQEVIDYVRNDRDTTAFQGGDWALFLMHYGMMPGVPSGCFTSTGCTVDVFDSNFSTSVVACLPSPAKCPTLRYDENATNGSYYNYASGGVATNFRRTVYMGNSNSGDELDILVKIEWQNGKLPRSQVLKSSLLKWQ